MAGRGLKVEQLAAMAGMTPATLYRRFAGSGSTSAFTVGEVAQLADALGIAIPDLFAGRFSLGAERSVNNRNLTTRQAAA